MSDFGDLTPDDVVDTAPPDPEALARFFVREQRRITGDVTRAGELEELEPLERALLVFTMAGYFGYLIRYESQHQGSALNRLSESGASLGTDGEAAAALWRLAGTEPRLADLRGRLGDRVSCNAGVLVDRQVQPGNPNPLARGAWFADGYTQMDDQQHAIAALLGAHEVLR